MNKINKYVIIFFAVMMTASVCAESVDTCSQYLLVLENHIDTTFSYFVWNQNREEVPADVIWITDPADTSYVLLVSHAPSHEDINVSFLRSGQYYVFARANDCVTLRYWNVRARRRLVCADTWHCVRYRDAFDGISVSGVTYTLSSDTLIIKENRMKRYKKLMEGNQCIGALRQSTDQYKVYYYDVTESKYTDTEECLLYDFTADIGDTIKNAYFKLDDIRTYNSHADEPESVGWLVIDKYEQDGRIHMDVARCYDDGVTKPRYQTHWIQGIGTANGLWPTLYGTSDYSILYTLCATKGDETLYTYDLSQLGIENNCMEWHLKTDDGENIITTHNLPLSIRGKHIQIQMSGTLMQAKIYNLNGQCVLQTNETDIDVSALPQGMYILRAETSDGVSHQAKFIKE